jgi:hypothetical protein
MALGMFLNLPGQESPAFTPDSSPHLFWLTCRADRERRGYGMLCCTTWLERALHKIYLLHVGKNQAWKAWGADTWS